MSQLSSNSGELIVDGSSVFNASAAIAVSSQESTVIVPVMEASICDHCYERGCEEVGPFFKCEYGAPCDHFSCEEHTKTYHKIDKIMINSCADCFISTGANRCIAGCHEYWEYISTCKACNKDCCEDCAGSKEEEKSSGDSFVICRVCFDTVCFDEGKTLSTTTTPGSSQEPESSPL